MAHFEFILLFVKKVTFKMTGDLNQFCCATNTAQLFSFWYKYTFFFLPFLTIACTFLLLNKTNIILPMWYKTHCKLFFNTRTKFFGGWGVLYTRWLKKRTNETEYWVLLGCKLQAIYLTRVKLGFYFHEDDDRKAAAQVNVLNTQVKNIWLQ